MRTATRLATFVRHWQKARQVPVPRCSLLASAAARARGEPDAHELILAGLPIIGDSVTELDVPLRVVFARSFFDSPLFRVERALLHLVGQGVATSNAEIQTMAFDSEAEHVACFRLVEKTRCETLFRWSVAPRGAPAGGTWLRAEQRADASVSLSLGSFVDRTEAGERRKLSSAMRFAYSQVLVPLHFSYSRLLLAAAAARFEEDVSRCRRHAVASRH